ncbi:hypothetical protein MMC34_002756 [Xylographa carneopallida]|nr:hypothetical protein [Xylographa carneopallida]
MWSSTNSTDGGLALNPKTKFDRGIEDNAGQSGPGRNAAVYVQNGVQIVVFGVSKENGKACMRFLDLSPHFDDPWGSALTDAIVPNGSKAIISDHTSTRTYKRLICTCPMHDLAYSVSLPEDASGICEVLEEKSLQSVDDFRLALPKGFEGRHRANERGWHDPYWNEAHAKLKFSQLGQHFKATLNGPGLLNRVSTSIHDVSSQSVDKGTVIQYVSAHRAAGLERLKKRGQLFIQIMRDDGIADEDIANWWSNAMWCWWNLLAKPDGWRRAAWQGVSRAFVPK